MKDGSLIYSDHNNKVIYRVSLNKQKTKLINTEYDPFGLCCTRSGDILVCMGEMFLDTARVVKYSSSGRKIQEFQIDQNFEALFLDPRFVCENINEDICISDCNTFGNSKVVVLNTAGNLRFTYDGKAEAGALKYFFQPFDVTTDSLGYAAMIRLFSGFAGEDGADLLRTSSHTSPRSPQYGVFLESKKKTGSDAGVAQDFCCRHLLVHHETPSSDCQCTTNLIIAAYILIADKANDAVHLISQDGIFLSLILTEYDGISLPFGISVDTSDNLWLVEQEKACIKLYQYLFQH
ncbi:uncharacterized protein LOC134242077 [Saccostrea cucullata]|uniref:uncharacterized protein LOC134242077 n=1 Tax=Saccostrea cuccullata TaxID=36930 RepID=UPI002ED61DFE